MIKYKVMSLSEIKKNQSGAISMLAVLVVTSILIVITVGFLRLALTGQGDSADADLSDRAYYAAEAGIEDAKDAIALALENSTPLSALEKSPACNHAFSDVVGEENRNILSEEAGLDTEYTCQLIDTKIKSYEADMSGVGDTVQLPLKGASAWDTLVIKWHSQDSGDGTMNARGSSDGDYDLLDTNAWSSANYAAMLRAMIFRTESNGGIPGGRNALNDTVDVAFINPMSGLAGGALSGYIKGNLESVTYNSKIGANCDPLNTGYACEVKIKGFLLTSMSKDYYLRLSNLYRSTHVQIQLLNSTGDPVEILGAQAIIDVTGRAGNVYRRVEARVDFTDPVTPWLPNYVVESAEKICKNFSISDSSSDFASINGAVTGSCRNDTSP